jgi:transcriptional regulator with XRE-family HTH domain
MDLARQLADSLRRLRQRAGLTQTEMARRLGISQPTLNRLENVAQNTTLKTLTTICRTANCDVGNLFSGRVSLSRGDRVAERSSKGRAR